MIRPVGAGDAAAADSRSVGWPLSVVVLVVIPCLAVFGNWAIFHLFGNGRYLPFDSTGSHVLHWWEGWGRPIAVGGVALLLLTLCRVRFLISVLLAIASAIASFLWLVVAVIIIALLNPGAFS